MSYKPNLVDGLFYVKKADKHLFLNPSIPDWVVLNSNAALLLSKADGKTGVEEIAASCGAEVAEVGELFRQAVNHGVIKDFSSPQKGLQDGIACNNTEKLNHNISKRVPLHTIHWKLTNFCNLQCHYCYAESGKNEDHMSLDELSRVAQEAFHLSPSMECVLSGGEPLLHPNVFEFGEFLKSLGNRVSLLTNGVLITSSNVDRIANFTDLVKISIDGSTEDIHARTRGRKNFDAVLNAFSLLEARGVNVQVAMTVHRGNVSDIDAMAQRFGSRLTFQPLFQAGRGADKDEMVLTGNEYYNALAASDKVAPMGAIAGVLERLRGRGVKRCSLADTGISISEKGDVYPCQLLTSSEFAAGNIREMSLEEIYLNSTTLSKARTVSVDTLEKCKECPIRLLCGGGCRARDFYEVGSIEEVGEFCEYEQQAFIHGIFDTATL